MRPDSPQFSMLKGTSDKLYLTKYLVEVGYMKKLRGTKNTGIHVAFLLCLGFLLLFFTLSLGHIFGKGQSSD